VKDIIAIAKQGSWEFSEFTPERKAQEPGDFYSDIRKIHQYTGWEQKISLEQGLALTLDYYRKYKNHYWENSPTIDGLEKAVATKALVESQ
jgi:UDP-glucose 4-epimerase